MERWSDADQHPEPLTVVDLVRTVMSDEAATSWLRSPNPNLGYQRPLDLVAAGDSQRVIDLLLTLAEGVTA